ncbi:1-acyl-sn-glycerol-3-phosphate acyltransferase [Arcanobacterium pluranimalium]|uniref:1-acyl-sn-glycerol-3-phosphate acyltransferase n=1 Tax=Arcanobacterium pluranimalium TaxID=108028 RepID=UPI00195C7405|nr:1-acyl-sn-glycerol-3-phosphate acyltransferase [Arcanobacterium pluranimalium]MBM7824479.1 1-acyl-sn-glycerol-3-phosphate acyltransferase [Arcanobacterium pluranimalium]
MSVTTFISHTFQKFSRLKLDYQPLPKKAIVIGAPHTSYWDGILMAVAFWDAKRAFKFLVKDSAMKSPFGPIIRKVGGISVDRSSAHGLVEQIAQQAVESDEFLLVIAPKGTRSPREFWKSGFYHIARQANIPVVLGYIDKTTKTYGWAHALDLTGDVHADMEAIRAFYADKEGINPQWKSTPRLRMEDTPAEPEAVNN